MKTIKYSKQAAKALRKMPAKQAKTFHSAFAAMAKGSMEGHQVEPLHGKQKGQYKVRKGGMRSIVEMDSNSLMVLVVKPRGDVYK